MNDWEAFTCEPFAQVEKPGFPGLSE
jgi:hypothetical protein